MQIVIDISKDFIDKMNSIEDDRELSCAQLLTVYRGFHAMLQNGTPLPKGHGRLIDADALKKLYDERISHLYELNKKDNPSRESKICATNWCNNTVEELPTIIEADNEESEEV